MFARLADRFVLRPSRNAIPASHKTRHTVRVEGRQVEVWIERTDGRAAPTIIPSVIGQPAPDLPDGNGRPDGERAPLPEPQIFVLKFNGAGGRAERASIHPLDFWSDVPGEIWSANPPGYGASEGRPSLQWLAPTGRAVLEELVKVAGSRPIVLTGNSLGTTVALRLAAEFAAVSNLAALLLRNPPPLRQLIAGKFGWRTLGLSLGVARQIPPDLDSVTNAARVKLPCVFMCAGCDRVVPPRFQQLIVNAYAGPKQVVTIPDADHVFMLSEPQLTEYGTALTWLRENSYRSF
ncbi:MAG TPA: alpha/beta hydrolase [Pirellulaceae bacterium]|nr:alpha/beta hydrolase [Pirellulaceae bacterium]